MAVALCTSGLLAGTLGSGLLGAGAQSTTTTPAPGSGLPNPGLPGSSPGPGLPDPGMPLPEPMPRERDDCATSRAGQDGRVPATRADCPRRDPSQRADGAEGEDGTPRGDDETERPRAEKRERRRREGGERPRRTPLRSAEGVPTLGNPTTSLALPGPAPVGVPNFFIDKFRIPPFLLPIYQAAGIEYGVRWEVLAAINEIETDYGRNLTVSSAGALGWMQFIPSTWKAYGVDANRDGKKDPYNPVDAIFAAARYLKAAGADKDLAKAIFAYNHADWYVDSVLMRARLVGGLPSDLIGSVSGLTQGRFPVAAKARYADDISEREAQRRVARGENAARPVTADETRRGIDVFAATGSAVVAAQDGTVEAVGDSERLGRYVRIRDAYGNEYTYGHLKRTAERVAVPKERVQSRASIERELKLPARDPRPRRPASAGRQTAEPGGSKPERRAPAQETEPAQPVVKERLFAHPGRPRVLDRGGKQQLAESRSELPGSDELAEYLRGVPGLRRSDVELRRLVPGRKVIAGTVLGRTGRVAQGPRSSHLRFEIRPAGRGAPRIDPKPILDGWKLLESTAVYRAQGHNPLVGGRASIGQILLMDKQALQRRVLANPRIELYSCGRDDVRSGSVDRRVLATLEFLAASGLRPTVTSLRCGRAGRHTASGNLSAHPSGNAVDIAKINGIPVMGNQGKGSITDMAVRRLLTLQGTLKPHQIITLMTYDDADNTLAMSDHADHIHVGFRPAFDPDNREGRRVSALLKPSQWIKLIERLGSIDNPKLRGE